MSDAVGFAARYHRATCLVDARRSADASSAWRELTTSGPEHAAEAFFRLANLEPDAGHELATLLEARKADRSAEQSIAFAASVQAMWSATMTEHWPEALDAALWLSRFPEEDDDASWAISDAIDALGGSLGGSRPPRPVLAKVALASARLAVERSDRARAERLWRDIDKDMAGTPEADVARGELSHASQPPSDGDMLHARLSALASTCRPETPSPVVIDVVGARTGVSLKSSDPDKNVVRCLETRKASVVPAAEKPLPAFRGSRSTSGCKASSRAPFRYARQRPDGARAYTPAT